MSPETLIGMEVGKSVLRRLLGQGSMGSVYLSSQASRQVAIKIFFSVAQLAQAERADFQKRLTQVIARNALLDHKNILKVSDYGTWEGLPYLVMPYVAGENLQQLLARSGALPFAQVQLYLGQLASALAYAHVQGVLHRDIRPENILLVPDGRLLLSDFGLAGLTIEKNFAHVRRATPGMLNTIAPEYVLNKPADERADIYALGVVLYHMVTGRTPFQSTSLIEMAMQHVNASPPAPASLRTDLPKAAAQVILRALAKTPGERFSRAQELASAFRLALASEPAAKQPQGALDTLTQSMSEPDVRPAAPRKGSLFDPRWQAFTAPPAAGTTASSIAPIDSPVSRTAPTEAPSPEQTAPTVAPTESSTRIDKKLNRTDQLPLENLQGNLAGASAGAEQEQAIHDDTAEYAPLKQSLQGTHEPSLPVSKAALFSMQDMGTNPKEERYHVSSSRAAQRPKGVDAPHIVDEPVRPVNQSLQQLVEQASGKSSAIGKRRRHPGKYMLGISFLLVLCVVVGSGVFWVARKSTMHQVPASPNPSQLATAAARATVNADLILTDDFAQNTHNWPVGIHGSFTYALKNGRYLIANEDKVRSASALFPNRVLKPPFAYSLTMEQLQGNTSSPNNQFGLLLNLTSHNTGGKQLTTFYAFEVANKLGGQYQFWKYDNRTNSTHPWTLLWSKKIGAEFQQGIGPDHVNTLKVIDTGKNFTFMVNGTQVGTWKDSSFTGGSIGMLVNQMGAEIAFSHLLVTYP